MIVEDLMGNEMSLKKVGGGIQLPLGQSPVYVMPRRISGEKILAAFSKAAISGVTAGKLGVTLSHRGGRPAVAIQLDNTMGEPLSGTAKITALPVGWEAESNAVAFRNVPAETSSVMYIPLRKYCPAPEGSAMGVSGMFAGQVMTATHKAMTLHVPERKATIKVDGEITEEEYGNAAVIRLDRADQMLTQRYVADWKGAEKGSAVARVLWDKKAIYVGIEVKDDVVLNNAPLAQLYAGDSVEAYFDTAPDRDVTVDAYQTHQGKFLCAPPNEDNPSGRVCPTTKKKQGVFDNLDLDKVVMVSKKTDDGYTLELKVPFSGMELCAGTVLGFDVNYIDQDGEPFHKKIQLAWAGKLSWANPHEMGFILLGK